MNFVQRPPLVLLAAALLIGLGGCSVLEPDKIDYKSAGRGVSLEVPPDLTQLPAQSRYRVADGAVTASSYQAGQVASQGAAGSQIAPDTVADVHFMREGEQRWLRVDRPADKIWGQVRDFWLENGFLMAIDQPRTGILETDWAENRAKIPQDVIRRTIGKVFDSLYSTGERDRFRTRVERNANGGTDIFITHQGMEEVYSSARRDSTIWQPRDSDPELEAEFLRRMMVTLGVSQQQSEAAVAEAASAAQAAGASAPQARLVDAGGMPAMQLGDDFDRAWRRVGLALDRTGFTVEDRDRGQGTYFVRYIDPKVKKDEPGFFGKLFGRGSAPLPTQEYRILVRSQDAGSLVVVQDNQGMAAPAADAQSILTVLTDALK